MRHAFRLTAVLLLALSLIAPAVTTAQTTPRLPSDAGDWATFTVVERQAAIDYERRLLDEGLRNGTIVPQRIVAPAGGGTVAPATVTASASGACGVEVSNANGGSWVNSDAWTDATVQAEIIYVHSEFYRDSAYLAGPNDDETYRSHAEARSGQNWSWAFEHPTYRVKSWHGAKYNGSWLIHDLPCDFSWTKP